MPFLMLGEALVDLVCEQAADGLADAPSFAPHFGGAAANVAVSASRSGGRAALARGAQAHAVPGRPAQVMSTIGAGDAFFGTLLARLQAAGWDAAALPVGDALTAAAEAGARATETWGAVA